MTTILVKYDGHEVEAALRFNPGHEYDPEPELVEIKLSAVRGNQSRRLPVAMEKKLSNDSLFLENLWDAIREY